MKYPVRSADCITIASEDELMSFHRGRGRLNKRTALNSVLVNI